MNDHRGEIAKVAITQQSYPFVTKSDMNVVGRSRGDVYIAGHIDQTHPERKLAFIGVVEFLKNPK